MLLSFDFMSFIIILCAALVQLHNKQWME